MYNTNILIFILLYYLKLEKLVKNKYSLISPKTLTMLIIIDSSSGSKHI